MTPDITVQWGLAVIVAALAAIAIIIAQMMADDRRLRQLPEPCPWCETRECLDSTRCTCDDPCGMTLCKALGSEVAP